jgi:hypothetical protein
MAQQLQSYSVNAPGFLGLNSESPPLDLESGWSLVANNAVIDRYGRIGARKGWTPSHTTLAALGSADVKAIGQVVTTAGDEYTVGAGNNKLFKLDGSTLTELTYGGGGVAPVITDSNWHMASLNGVLYLFQRGHDPLVFDPAVSTTQYRRVSEKTGYAGTVPQGNIVLSAYGRLWVADTTTNKTTVYFSDLLSGHVWTAGSSGSLNVNDVWPMGADNITGLAAHNGFLFIFGKHATLVYQGATMPASMTLADTVSGIGCVARDSIANTGSDVLFLSSTGVRSVARTIQENSAPLRDLSKNVRTDLINAMLGETLSNIKSVYSRTEGFYLLTFPALSQVYCFDMKYPLQDGSARVTTWDSITPKSFCLLRNDTLLIGKAGYIAAYTGYTDNGSSYRYQYFTNHTDFGAPDVTSILKRMSAKVIGGSDQAVSMKWAYDFSGNFYPQTLTIPTAGTAEYGTAEYGEADSEYSAGAITTTLMCYPTGSGKVVQVGIEADIEGSALSVQKLEVQAKNGKIT